MFGFAFKGLIFFYSPEEVYLSIYSYLKLDADCIRKILSHHFVLLSFLKKVYSISVILLDTPRIFSLDFYIHLNKGLFLMFLYAVLQRNQSHGQMPRAFSHSAFLR